MLISQKKLKKVAVETQSGQFLGHISDFEVETDTGVIEKYYVRAKNLIAGLLENSLIINKAQIISFDDSRMVVEDAVVKVKSVIRSKITKSTNLESTEPVVTAEES
ncbi:MAG: hypothetical protein NT116_04675 [Candidatus Parcubacteria bacterium]|nr:hypothetical protein [Candidatus Parcubacteria bacterium]